ncbi:Gfo/Idh/MocA family protein [Bradyrhizobium sp.]|uniref:Gfo/Idh/MocA family protein n=1 Tax=Bradyrhizobium sp. TaxID=376 RepID=UPI004037F4F7
MTANSPAGLRAAVIGLGRMGTRHLEAVTSLGMIVVGAADTDQKARAAAQDGHGIGASACFSDGVEMLRSVRPEALVIATTAPSHAPLVLAAAEAGVRYILCEKPMATSLRDAQEMLETCRRAGAVLAINHQMRFMEQYTRVKSLIGSEALGPLASVLVAASNFGLAMNGSHYFEMFRYVSGLSVHAVNAWFEDTKLANPRGAQFEDRSGRILARTADGVSMYLDFSVNAGSGVSVIYTCRNGQIFVDELNGAMRVVSRKAEFRDLPTTRYGMPSNIYVENIAPADVVGPTKALWSALLDGQSYPDGEAGLHALACCVAAHVSHENGGNAVRVDDQSLPSTHQFKWA